MRRRRAIVFDDEKLILYLLNYVLSALNFEVLTFTSPLMCPLYTGSQDACTKEHPCADVMITDYHMPDLNGLELIKKQDANGCKMPLSNKAIMSGHIDHASREELQRIGCAYFEKPIELDELTTWLSHCEARMPLDRPLACRRVAERYELSQEIQCFVGHNGGGTLINGTTVNVSDTGVCLKIPAFLERGQHVRLVTHVPPDIGGLFMRPSAFVPAIHLSDRTASVSWINHQGNGMYMAGMQFA